jgi:hypothetical protein
MLAASIAAIQDISFAQKEIQSKLADIKKAKKEYLREQISAHEALGKARYEHYTARIADFFADFYADISLLQEKIAMEEAARSEADEDEPPKNLFTRFISNMRASTRDATMRHLAGQLKKLYAKAGGAAAPQVALLTASNSLDADVLSAFENCKELQAVFADLEERETALAADFAANIQALKEEGVTGVNLISVRIADINRQINAKTADENALAAKVGKAYTDTLLTEEGKALKKISKELETGSLLEAAAENRNEIARCKLSIEICEAAEKIDRKTKIMRQNNERILDNQAKIQRLTGENSSLAAQIAEADEQRKAFTAEKDDLEKRLKALAGLAE